jgi:uridine kinase
VRVVKGDRIVVEEHHLSAAARIVPLLLGRIQNKTSRYVIIVAGESGSGKSEMARALADALREQGIGAAVIGQDDYFVLPPRSNDARRRADPEWLGPHVEVRLDLLDANLRDAIEGQPAIVKPLVDYDADRIDTETLNLETARVVIAEGTYTSLLRHVDTRIFIARTRLDTLEHRRKRNRGNEVADPFVEQVLATEHRIVAGHRWLADYVITSDYDVVEAH